MPHPENGSLFGRFLDAASGKLHPLNGHAMNRYQTTFSLLSKLLQ